MSPSFYVIIKCLVSYMIPFVVLIFNDDQDCICNLIIKQTGSAGSIRSLSEVNFDFSYNNEVFLLMSKSMAFGKIIL